LWNRYKLISNYKDLIIFNTVCGGATRMQTLNYKTSNWRPAINGQKLNNMMPSLTTDFFLKGMGGKGGNTRNLIT